MFTDHVIPTGFFVVLKYCSVSPQLPICLGITLIPADLDRSAIVLITVPAGPFKLDAGTNSMSNADAGADHIANAKINIIFLIVFTIYFSIC
jgi:hypothetical protein